MRPRHKHGERCPKCEQMLEGAHPKMREWFLRYLKPCFPEAHISCAYRGEEDQERAFREGKSKARFGKSPHNAIDESGNPCSRALDIFVLSEDGKHALFPKAWYKDLFDLCVVDGAIKITWGGNFKTLGDANHFELT